MSDRRDKDKPLGIKGLLGLGLDAEDEHKRITRGKNFLLLGGSRETHEKMQETAIKFNENVKKRGKPLEKITAKELHEITSELREKIAE